MDNVKPNPFKKKLAETKAETKDSSAEVENNSSPTIPKSQSNIFTREGRELDKKVSARAEKDKPANPFARSVQAREIAAREIVSTASAESKEKISLAEIVRQRKEAAARKKYQESSKDRAKKEVVDSINEAINRPGKPKFNFKTPVIKHHPEIKAPDVSALTKSIERAANKAQPAESVTESFPAPAEEIIEGEFFAKDQITYEMLNDQQKLAVDFASQLKSFCLIGSAGSGKTTTQRVVGQVLAELGKIRRLESTNGHKKFGIGSLAIAIVSFTNKAVENIRDAMPTEFKNNCMTMHKFVQYVPEKVSVTKVDPDTGEEYDATIMQFVPTFGPDNPLPHFDVIIAEESSNIEDLFWEQKIVAALPQKQNTCFIFIGDINQLPPVFGVPVLGRKFIELPIVKLETTYRTKDTSPIKLFAMDILKGFPMRDEKVLSYYKEGEFEPVIFKSRVDPERAVEALGAKLGELIEENVFVPGRDIVLTPFNTGGHVNVHNLNLYMAEKIRVLEDKEIHEIFAGFNKFYLAIGDIVFSAKRPWKIKDISRNSNYSGLPPREATKNLDRWGNVINHEMDAGESFNIDAFFSAHAKVQDKELEEEKVNRASHVITLEPYNKTSDEDSTDNFDTQIENVGEFADFQFGYALTVHKSQGSEWHHVVLILHHSQMSMANRELLYTATTRARTKLSLWFDGENKSKFQLNSSWLQRGIVNQAIPGDGLDAKIEYFKNLAMAEQQAKDTGVMVLTRRAKIVAKKKHGENFDKDQEFEVFKELFKEKFNKELADDEEVQEIMEKYFPEVDFDPEEEIRNDSDNYDLDFDDDIPF